MRWKSRTVAIIAAEASADIDLHDIALIDNYLIRGYSVYDLVIKRDTSASGEATVVEESGSGSALLDEAADLGINLFGRYTGLDSVAGYE